MKHKNECTRGPPALIDSHRVGNPPPNKARMVASAAWRTTATVLYVGGFTLSPAQAGGLNLSKAQLSFLKYPGFKIFWMLFYNFAHLGCVSMCHIRPTSSPPTALTLKLVYYTPRGGTLWRWSNSATQFWTGHGFPGGKRGATQLLILYKVASKLMHSDAKFCFCNLKPHRHYKLPGLVPHSSM